MKLTITLFIIASSVPAAAQYGWQKVDTVTTGNFTDVNPRADHSMVRLSINSPVANGWVVFERWNDGFSSIAAVRYMGSAIRWDSTVYTISPAAAGALQKNPDVCSVSKEILVGSEYQWKSFAVAVWQEKTDSVWNIYYSTCDPDTTIWSLPTPLTRGSVDCIAPTVQSITDSTLIVLWKSDSTIFFSIIGRDTLSSPQELVTSNTDSVQFDYLHFYFGAEAYLAWTERGDDSNRICLISTLSPPFSGTITANDTIALGGDIQDPRFMKSFAPLLTFNLVDSGKYQAWASEFYSNQWSSSVIAADTNSDNLDAAFFSPPMLVTGQKFLAKTMTSLPWGFGAWERRTTEDTTLVFTQPDTVRTAGYNMSPSFSTLTFPIGWSNEIGFVVFESNRTGYSHIYSRSFVYSLGAVDESPSTPRGFVLYQNYPNPFNPTTAISYKLSAISSISLTVYDILGRKVGTIVNARQSPGEHFVTFNGRGLASGVYFYRLETEGMMETGKMILMK